MTAPRLPSKLTLAADAFARTFGESLPDDADPQLAARFRDDLGTLLARTLEGATTMASGAVVAVDHKVERLAEVRGKALLAVQDDLNRLSKRVHLLEDAQLADGIIGRIQAALAEMMAEIESLKAQTVGDTDAS